jgi:hypothetical protein
MDAPRKTVARWLVWGFVPLAAGAGAYSAFAEPAVRTVEIRYGQMSTYGLEVHVWGVRLHRESIRGTPATLYALALARESQWRFGLAAATAWVSGGVTAAAAAAVFVRPMARNSLRVEYPALQ